MKRLEEQNNGCPGTLTLLLSSYGLIPLIMVLYYQGKENNKKITKDKGIKNIPTQQDKENKKG